MGKYNVNELLDSKKVASDKSTVKTGKYLVNEDGTATIRATQPETPVYMSQRAASMKRAVDQKRLFPETAVSDRSTSSLVNGNVKRDQPLDIRQNPASRIDQGVRNAILNVGVNAIDLLNRPSNAVVNAIKESGSMKQPEFTKINSKLYKNFNKNVEKDVGGAFVRGLTGQERPDPLEMLYSKEKVSEMYKTDPIMTGAGSFIFGGVTDPTLALGGISAKGIFNKIKGIKTATKIDDVIKTEKEVQNLLNKEIADKALRGSKINPNYVGAEKELQNAVAVHNPEKSAQLSRKLERSPEEFIQPSRAYIRASTIEKPNLIKNTTPTKEVHANGTQNVITPTKNVGKEPVIPEGQKERGFSANTRTDVNNPDALRESYSTNPLTYEQIGNPTTLARAQAIFDQGYESARTQVSELASRMQPEAVPLAKMLSRQATEAGNIQGAREIISDVAEKLTQAGQFSQAARILREADPETFLLTINKQLKNLNKQGFEVYGKKWKDFDLAPEELDMVSKIERGNQASYESAFEAIQKRIANEMPSNAMEKVNAWRHMSMLLNPKTHIRNIGGNAIMMGMRKTAQRVSGMIQSGVKLINPKFEKTQSVFVKKEYKQSARDYFEANKKDLLSGANKYNETLTMNMPDKRVFKNNALEATRKFNYKLLELGDTPFFKNAYIDRLASYAQAKGIKDFSQLGQEAFDIAKKEAEQATYKDAAMIATFLNKIKHPGANANLGQKAGAVITEAALPFTKTPINIIKRGIQYSPAGIINGISKIRSSAGAAAAIDEMAKGLTGTAILGLGYLLASKGILTGKAESDKDLAEYNKNTGNSPFSILGKYTYDWMQPFAVPLTIGVEIYNAIKDSPEDAKKMDALIQNTDTEKWKEITKTFALGLLDSFNASGDTVFNMSFMKGVRQLLGSGTQGVMEGLARLPQNYAMQFIPTMLNQVAGQIDTTVRQTYYNGNPVESARATALSKIPFASRILQPKQTPWGQDVMRNENPLVRAFSQFLSPGIVAEPQNINPEVDAELRRLNRAGETIQFPTIAATSFTWKGQKFDLAPKEYTDFQKTLGQNTLAAYADFIKTPEYNALNDSEKAKELSLIISDAKDLAKFQLIQSKGLAKSPEIMSVPEKFTINKKELPMTFSQQNELADLINKYKKQYSLNKNLTPERVEQAAKDRAYTEMKRKLFKSN